MFARLGAIVFIAVAVTAAAIEMTRQEDAPIYQSVDRAGAETADPLRAELIRCAGIGEAGPRDPSCLRAWAENRRRFLAPGARPAEPLPEAPRSPRPTATIPAPAVPLQPEEAK
ncbi:putative entry exclusion protein TrbK-alt [Afipia birgiae]|jgi:conjugative transfer region protein TrbK|uniref:putative entry exclusion protein TrbK-alt n=1 Tax=Afipia birgiae TaxID=151414 RepID=UPI000371BF1C|nr:putative entry exclusion protein TrbK-alt [Afipia birgiae]